MIVGFILIVIGLIAFFGSRSAGEGPQRAGGGAVGTLLILGGIGSALYSCIVVVDAGHVGVVKLFGKVSPEALEEGMHFVNPFVSIEQMSVRTDEYTMSGVHDEGMRQGDDAIRTLSKDGLPLPVDVTITYRPTPSMVPWLYRNIGKSEDLVAKIIRPASRAAVRDSVAMFTAQEAYSTKREQLAMAISQGLERYIQNTLSKSESKMAQSPNSRETAFIIQQVLVRNIELPERLKASIEAKLTAEQESFAMKYKLDKERQEAERKRIEAKGIADFQTIVSQGISDKLLQWKGIEATQELATSTNAKVVIIGSGKGGLPVILNSDGGVSTGK